MSSLYIGIDNGLSGALVAISAHHGIVIASAVMPTIKKTKGNEVDSLAVKEWLSAVCAGNLRSLCVILETPGKQGVRFRDKFGEQVKGGSLALCSMWDSYGAIRSILETNSIRHHRITPQAWQKVMIPGTEKGDTKPAALHKARQLWPDEKWLATQRCSKPHDGMIDAALMAEFGRITKL